MNYTNTSFWHTTKGYCLNNSQSIENKCFDILIIGAGLSGLNTAYLLSNKGYNIGIIDSSRLGFGVSGYTTAKITVQHNLIYDYLIQNFGLNTAQNYLQANLDGIDFYKSIIKSLNIDCDFTLDKAVLYTSDINTIYDLKTEQDAYKKLSIKSKLVDSYSLPFPIAAGLEIDEQYKLNPLKYLYSLAENLNQSNIGIYENIRAIDIIANKKPYKVITDRGQIYANKVIITSHYPFDRTLGMFFLKQIAERSYVIACETNVPHFDGMYLSIDKDIRSLRFQKYKEKSILLLGGCNHKAGLIKDENVCYKALEQYLLKYFSKYKLLAKWSAQDCMSHDKIPYIGNVAKNHKDIYAATGFNKWGMTTSAASAIIISNMILNNNTVSYDNIFCPYRSFSLNATSTLKLSKAVIHSFSGLCKSLILNSGGDIDNMNIFTGRIVAHNTTKIAVFRENENIFHCVKPTCSHLGCEIKFNEAEKTWDCQCHGSRYDIYGNILEGPATKPLKYAYINKDNL